jgi:hypothetical protein
VRAGIILSRWYGRRDVALVFMKICGPVRWMIGSAVPAFLSIGGFYAAGACAVDSIRPVAIALATLAWISFVTLWISFLCWIASNMFPVDRH